MGGGEQVGLRCADNQKTGLDERNDESFAKRFREFGRVQSVAVSRTSREGFVFFESGSAAKKAVSFLQNKMFFGEKLVLEIEAVQNSAGNCKRVTLPADCTFQKAAPGIRCFMNICVWPALSGPTRQLLLVGVPTGVSFAFLKELFGMVHRPRKLKVVLNFEQKRSIVVEFDRTHEAVEALAELQGQMVNDFRLWMTFCEGHPGLNSHWN